MNEPIPKRRNADTNQQRNRELDVAETVDMAGRQSVLSFVLVASRNNVKVSY